MRLSLAPAKSDSLALYHHSFKILLHQQLPLQHRVGQDTWLQQLLATNIQMSAGNGPTIVRLLTPAELPEDIAYAIDHMKTPKHQKPRTLTPPVVHTVP